MNPLPLRDRRAGFTLVELLIGVSLALMIMTAVLSSYVTLARNFTRSLGVTSANQPALEAQSRRVLAYFAQDTTMATDISGTPSASSVTLTLPTSSGTTTVTYTYSSAAGTLTRAPASGATLTLHSSLLSFYFRYYDVAGNPYDNGSSPYTTDTTYPSGIKQVSFVLTSQAGNSTIGTLTSIYAVASPRFLVRNKALIP